jgi:hypothetical protein
MLIADLCTESEQSAPGSIQHPPRWHAQAAGHFEQTQTNLKTERSIAWDVYLLYGAAAQWDEAPAMPDFWMHQLGGVTRAPRLDEAAFTAELKAMMGKMKTSQTTSPPLY